MKALREAKRLPIPEVAERARQLERAANNCYQRMNYQESQRASLVTYAKERERLAAFILKPLPRETKREEVLLEHKPNRGKERELKPKKEARKEPATKLEAAREKNQPQWEPMQPLSKPVDETSADEFSKELPPSHLSLPSDRTSAIEAFRDKSPPPPPSTSTNKRSRHTKSSSSHGRAPSKSVCVGSARESREGSA